MPVSFGPASVARGALFPRGYGLSLAAGTRVAQQSEDPRVSPAHAARDTLFAAGHVTAPQSVYIADRLSQVRLTMQTLQSPAGAISVALGTQGLRASWDGSGQGALWIGGRAADYSGATAQNLALRIHLRVDSSATHRVKLGMRCEAPYGPLTSDASGSAPPDWSLCGRAGGAMLDFTRAFATAAPGSWQTLELPVACLNRAGAQLAHVNAPFAIETDGALAISIDEIAWVTRSAPANCAGSPP
jgi:beta-glucosidase